MMWRWTVRSLISTLWDGSSIHLVQPPTEWFILLLSSTDGFVPEWWLTQITDRNGNSQAYVYDSNKSLVAITNSCGRKVRIDYSMAGEVDVFDTIDQTTNPVVDVCRRNDNK